MEVSFQLDKIIKFTTRLIFFTSGGDVDEEMLMRLSLIKEIMKDAKTMCISFSVKHL